LIRMFFSDHPPPHFHARYGEFEATIEIAALNILEGELPAGCATLVGRTPGSAADPLVGCSFGEKSAVAGAPLSYDALPEAASAQQSIFLTWRLHDSLPSNRACADALSRFPEWRQDALGRSKSDPNRTIACSSGSATG
jgi:hypothetical protein